MGEPRRYILAILGSVHNLVYKSRSRILFAAWVCSWLACLFIAIKFVYACKEGCAAKQRRKKTYDSKFNIWWKCGPSTNELVLCVFFTFRIILCVFFFIRILMMLIERARNYSQPAISIIFHAIDSIIWLQLSFSYFVCAFFVVVGVVDGLKQTVVMFVIGFDDAIPKCRFYCNL